jgi:hypothetical protein
MLNTQNASKPWAGIFKKIPAFFASIAIPAGYQIQHAGRKYHERDYGRENLGKRQGDIPGREGRRMAERNCDQGKQQGPTLSSHSDPRWEVSTRKVTRQASQEPARTVSQPAEDFGKVSSAFFVCAEHVRQLEGESPFDNLMEVKS